MLINFKQLKLKDALIFFSFPAVFYIFPRQVVKFFQFFKNLIIRPSIVEPNLAGKPSWANYLAQSINGYWKWYKEEPVLNKFGFWVNSSKQEIAGYTPLIAEYTSYLNLSELITSTADLTGTGEVASTKPVQDEVVKAKKVKTTKKQ